MAEFDYSAALRHLVNAESALIVMRGAGTLEVLAESNYKRCKARVEEHPQRLPRKQELERMFTIIEDNMRVSARSICGGCVNYKEEEQALEYGKKWVVEKAPKFVDRMHTFADVGAFYGALPGELKDEFQQAWRTSQTIVCSKIGLKVHEPLLYVCPEFESVLMSPDLERNFERVSKRLDQTSQDALKEVRTKFQREYEKLTSTPLPRL